MTLPTIEDARRVADSFRASLPREVAAASLTLKSKTPFKALVLREALIHRVSSLADGSISEFDSGRWIAATILVRAVVETTALLFALDQKVTRALQGKSDGALTEFLRRTMVSSRTEPNLPEAINVLNFIDAVEKDFPGFRRSYEDLSEYAHPNWCGVLGAFSELDAKTHTVAFGAFDRVPATTNISGLVAALVVAEYVYNNCATQIDRLNQAFETGEITYAA
jgi:hypothetical protein